jgi:hypothetical protein
MLGKVFRAHRLGADGAGKKQAGCEAGKAKHRHGLSGLDIIVPAKYQTAA